MARPREDFPFDTTHIRNQILADQAYQERSKSWVEQAEESARKIKPRNGSSEKVEIPITRETIRALEEIGMYP